MTLTRHRPLFLCILFTGIALRFYALDRQVLWWDEWATLSRLKGVRPDSIFNVLSRTENSTVGDLMSRYRVNSSDSVSMVIDGTAPFSQHTPTFFVLLQKWIQAGWRSNGEMRILTAGLGVVFLLLLHLLTKTLGIENGARYQILLFFSVSPLWVLYAREIRQYSLWSVGFVIGYLTFLEAIKKPHYRLWAYPLAMGVAFYFSLFNLLLIPFHALTLWLRGDRLTSWGISWLSSLAVLVPWFCVITLNRESVVQSAGWFFAPIALTIYEVARNASLSFFAFRSNPGSEVLLMFTPLVILALSRLRKRDTVAFLLAPPVFFGFVCFLSDLIFATQFMNVPRYLFPFHFAMGVLVTLGLNELIYSRRWHRSIAGVGIGVSVLGLTLVTSIRQTLSSTPWQKGTLAVNGLKLIPTGRCVHVDSRFWQSSPNALAAWEMLMNQSADVRFGTSRNALLETGDCHEFVGL